MKLLKFLSVVLPSLTASTANSFHFAAFSAIAVPLSPSITSLEVKVMMRVTLKPLEAKRLENWSLEEWIDVALNWVRYH